MPIGTFLITWNPEMARDPNKFQLFLNRECFDNSLAFLD